MNPEPHSDLTTAQLYHVKVLKGARKGPVPQVCTTRSKTNQWLQFKMAFGALCCVPPLPPLLRPNSLHRAFFILNV